ncbi:MAG: IMP cyclohydrolase [Patescibacteria group bacterium]
MSELEKLAHEAMNNAIRLAANPYPGRGFVIGRTEDGTHVVQVYWLMGRSENSRSRRLVHDGNVVRTEAVDPSKVTDPSLVIYNAMRTGLFEHVVSNGNQTDTICDGNDPQSFVWAMRKHTFEPDAPHYTPRISGICHTVNRPNPSAEISVISRSHDGSCQRTLYFYEQLPVGFGYCVHTYAGDGNPLPSFLEAPYVLPLQDDIEMVSQSYWEKLNAENRVALVTKFINVTTGESKVHIINRF